MKSWLTLLTAASIGAALAWPSAASAKQAENLTAAGISQAGSQIAAQAKAPMESDGIIRLSRIEIYPQYLTKINSYLIKGLLQERQVHRRDGFTVSFLCKTLFTAYLRLRTTSKLIY